MFRRQSEVKLSCDLRILCFPILLLMNEGTIKIFIDQKEKRKERQGKEVGRDSTLHRVVERAIRGESSGL